MSQPASKLRIVSLLFLISLGLPTGIVPEGPELPDWVGDLGYRAGEVTPITLDRFGFPQVPITLDGRAATLIFDTGNMKGLTLSRGIATRLGLPATGEARDLDSEGTVRGTFEMYEVDEVKVFGDTFRKVRAHEEWREDLGGLVGPRFLRGKRFTIDYRNRLMAVSDSPLPEDPRSGETFPMVLSPEHEGMILIRGRVNRRKVLIQVDTGKSRTVVDPVLIARLDLPEVKNGYRIDEIRLGSFRFSAPSAKEKSFRGISEGLPEPILLGIGSDILSRVLFSVGYPDHRVLLRRPMIAGGELSR